MKRDLSNVRTMCLWVAAAALAAGSVSCSGETTKPLIAGSPAKLVIGVQPASVVAGASINPAITVVVQDSQGRIVDTSHAFVWAGISGGTAGAHLRGAVSATASGGVATFPDLSIDSAGTGYPLMVIADGVPTVMSAAFDVSPGPPAKLAFSTQPAAAAPGAAIDPAVRVTVQDNMGNRVPIAASITIRLDSSSQGLGTLAGTVTQNAVGGVATFPGLHINQTGVYVLSAQEGSRVATSSAFNIFLPVGAVSSGDLRTCALMPDGAVECWGYGLLGDGSDRSSLTPVVVSGGLHFTSVDVGSGYACGVAAGGAAYCWGGNGSGQLGDGSTVPRLTPVPVAGGLTFRSVSAATHTCGLTTAGAVYCWGPNEWGQLGDGSTNASAVPVAVSGGLVFASLTVGSSVSCGVTTEGGAYCWGANYYGQLGSGSLLDSSSVPVAVSGELTFASIATGTGHTCGLTPAGAAYCWGYNGNGQTGAGYGSRRVPAAVAGGVTFAAISAGGDQTCAIGTGGPMYCWGSTTDWQIPVYGFAPALQPGGLTFASLSVGQSHSCAVTSAGAPWCWGSNGSGQLGDGGTTSTSRPTLVHIF